MKGIIFIEKNMTLYYNEIIGGNIMSKYEIRWQEWDETGRILVHDYINFYYNSLLLEGREDVISRYEYCMDQFKKLSKDRRVAGLIFAGRYDFSISEVE